MSRNLLNVIRDIKKATPPSSYSFITKLNSISDSYTIAAPEMSYLWWNETHDAILALINPKPTEEWQYIVLSIFSTKPIDEIKAFYTTVKYEVTTKRVIKPAMVKVKCANKSCSVEFEARVADRKRGWGKYCSKSCKAIVQEKRTGQYANMIHNEKRRHYENEYGGAAHFDRHGDYVGFTSQFSNEEHDCNKD